MKLGCPIIVWCLWFACSNCKLTENRPIARCQWSSSSEYRNVNLLRLYGGSSGQISSLESKSSTNVADIDKNSSNIRSPSPRSAVTTSFDATLPLLQHFFRVSPVLSMIVLQYRQLSIHASFDAIHRLMLSIHTSFEWQCGHRQPAHRNC